MVEVTPQEEWEERVVREWNARLANDEARIAALMLEVRGHLAEQCFWAYPPPFVEEDSRQRRVHAARSGAQAVYAVMNDYTDQVGFNASLELYIRYKYGRAERKYFRDHARRKAARCMVKLHLFMIGYYAD